MSVIQSKQIVSFGVTLFQQKKNKNKNNDIKAENG
jgi:hypothetical protein